MSSKLAKTQRSRREMDKKAPKLIENVKTVIGIKGPKTSQLIHDVLKDIHKFKAPQSMLLTKKNITRPFEDVSSVEFLGKVNDASLFSYGSHSKKRPHNLIMGRLFDAQLLDMFEFGINADSFRGMESFEGIRKAVVRVGSKPIMIFQGEQFDSNADFTILKNFFLDFFRGEVMQKINLSALDRVIIVTATDSAVHFRHYGVSLKKSSTNLPRVELDEVGPRMDLTLRRRKAGSDDLVREALRQPKSVTKAGANHAKNTGRNAIGDATGRIHMQRQDLANLNVVRMKGLKKRKRGAEGEEGEGGVETDGDGMMIDVNESSPTARTASARPASSYSSRAPSAAATAKKMAGVSNNNMDEFSSRSVGSASSSRASTVDKNLQRKKAGGFGSKPIEGGYKSVAKKKKTQ